MSFLEKAKLTRRKFLQTGTAAAALGALGCGNKLKAVEPVSTHEEKGEWISAACWHNCGGRCVNKVLVDDGIVIRQKTDDTHADSFDYPQQRGCLRGRSQRRQVFAADRLKYPMVRKGWKPGGANHSLRGRDEWVRVSWDEALNLAADEMKRIKNTYGNNAILADGYDDYKNTLAAFGGYVDAWSTTSYGSWAFTPQLCGYAGIGATGTTINDRYDFQNCDTIIMVGANPAWTSSGTPSFIFYEAKKAGVEFIGVDPIYNESYAMLDATWVPVRPATDTALFLAIAHTLITEDNPETNPLIDWEFLNKCSIGFDADSMPEGSDKKKNFKDYVLGTYDKQPKDAKWASEICGACEEQIKMLAYKLGTTNKTAFLASWSLGRINNGDNLPQLVMTIGAMTGQMGKPGKMTGVSTGGASAANGGPNLVQSGGTGLPSVANPVKECLNENDHWAAVMGKPYNDTGCHTAGKWAPRQVRTLDIHMIFYGMRAKFQTKTDLLKGIEAIRSNKVDCIIASAQFLTNNAKYADIVFPVSTEWERPGGTLKGNREMLIVHSQVTAPLYECKSDYWVVTELAKRLGLNTAELLPHNEKQIFFNKLAGATVINESGTGYEPLCTITEADITRWGVIGKAQHGRIAIDELVKRGVYQVPRKKGDAYGFIAFEKFRNDPENNPSKYSKSGKFEIYCEELAYKINDMGYSKIEPIPTYIPPVNGYEHTFADWNKKSKGKYPYQMVTMHYLKRSHTVFDNVKQLSEAFKNPVYISAVDAKREGIVTGNTVLMESTAGKTLRTAMVSRRVMPGCVVMLHGSWSDIDENTGLDYGGCDNVLAPAVSTGQAVTGYNSLVINISKYSDAPLTPDAEKPLRMVNL